VAKLLLKDGTVLEVDYNRAATIRQLLDGETMLDPKDPEYARKKTFLERVQDVHFDDITYAKQARPWEKWIRNKRWFENT